MREEANGQLEGTSQFCAEIVRTWMEIASQKLMCVTDSLDNICTQNVASSCNK